MNFENVFSDDEELSGMDADILAVIEQGEQSARTAFKAYKGLEGFEVSSGCRLVVESWKKLQRKRLWSVTESYSCGKRRVGMD